MKNNEKMPALAKLLLILHILLGIGAIGGGAVLILDPSGTLIGMPRTMLGSSPFSSFLIPGIILFLVLGVGTLTVAHALFWQPAWSVAKALNPFKNLYWAWAYSIYMGFALIIWIALETYFIQAVAGIHLFYLFYGLAIVAVTILPSVQKYYSR